MSRQEPAVTKLVRSSHYARRGLWFVLTTQRSFRIQLFLGAVAFALTAWLRLPPWKIAIIVTVSFLVWTLECVNTAVEEIVNLVSRAITNTRV